MEDSYKTIVAPAQGYIVEKKSKFISHIVPVDSVDEIKPILEEYRKKYYDARHVCWAYMIGADREEFRANDDGEPSGTGGRPILGQINSFELTNVLILVVRYFGGTLLGTSGLIKAYKEAAQDAIENADIIIKIKEDVLKIEFEYPLLNEVMRVLKQFEDIRWKQDFNENCTMNISVRKSVSEELSQRLKGIYGVRVSIN